MRIHLMCINHYTHKKIVIGQNVFIVLDPVSSSQTTSPGVCRRLPYQMDHCCPNVCMLGNLQLPIRVHVNIYVYLRRSIVPL